MEEERQLGKKIINNFIGEKFSDSIEKNLYEYSKQSKLFIWIN